MNFVDLLLVKVVCSSIEKLIAVHSTISKITHGVFIYRATWQIKLLILRFTKVKLTETCW